MVPSHFQNLVPPTDLRAVLLGTSRALCQLLAYLWYATAFIIAFYIATAFITVFYVATARIILFYVATAFNLYLGFLLLPP